MRVLPRDRAAIAGVALSATLVLLFGLLGSGLGYANGDAAVYAAQGRAGDLADRFVHVGWIAVAAALAPWAGDGLPAWLDRVNVLAALTALGLVAALARPRGAPALTAAGFAAVVLPVAPFAEVDVPWVALVLLAARVPGPLAALSLAFAITLSPTALLAVPWLLVERRDARLPILLGAFTAVGLLSLPHDGAWWLGERGVLRAPPPRLLDSARAWALHGLPWFLLPFAWRLGAFRLLATTPLLLAPPDTAAWLLPGAVVALAVAPPSAGDGRPQRALLALALAGQLALGVWGWHRRCEQVRADMEALGQVLAWRTEDDGLVAAWSWGVRASVLATGDPYALPWRVPLEPVRAQADWCLRPLKRVIVLPPGARVVGPSDWRPGPAGTWWAPGDDPGWRTLPGCSGG